MTQDFRPPTLHRIISDIPPVVGAYIVIMAVASYIHELFYYYVIQKDLFFLLSPADFLRSALSWVPWFCILISFGTILNYFDAEARAKAFRQDQSAAAAIYKWPDRLMQALQISMLILGVIVLPFINISTLGFLQVPIYIIIIYFFTRLVVSGRIPLTERPVPALLFYGAVIAIFVSAPFSGVSNAISDLRRVGPIMRVKTSTEDHDCILLRGLEKGILVKITSNQSVAFITYDDLKSTTVSGINVPDTKFHELVRSWFSR